MSEIDLAWLAGFVDGEGCISAYVLRRGSSSYLNKKVEVYQSGSVDTLNRIVDVCGYGSVKSVPVSSPLNKLAKYCWGIYSKSAIVCVLESLIPYLYVKKNQAEAMIELCQTSDWCRKMELTEALRAMKHAGVLVSDRITTA